MTDKWDASIPFHHKVAHGIEIGCGIASLRPIAEARQALKNVGFEILVDDDLADRESGVQAQADPRRRPCCMVLPSRRQHLEITNSLGQ
jgi:phosphoglycolate phosphatase-like HAD superfamily hydrolase